MDNLMNNTAVFIDGDNIHINNLKFNLLFNEISSKNNIIIKRVYGDWKLESMNHFWDKHILDNSLEEIQISRLSGKNSTDSKIIVDAMDLICNTNHVSKIILIGCDKDYIPLIRYAIQYDYIFEVYGINEQTSYSIINACTYYYDINEYLDKINNKSEYSNFIENQSNITPQKIIYNNYDEIFHEDNDQEYVNYDQIYITLCEFIPINGIPISELKKSIKKYPEKKEIFGKNFNKLSKFIEKYYKDYFSVKIKNGKVTIIKK